MADEAGDACAEREALHGKLEYWHKRLDHTLSHIHTATRLIYLADGAVLGFCYFWITALGVTRGAIFTASIPVFLLAVMNYFHAGMIGNQQSWFRGIDDRLRELLDEPEVKHKATCLSRIFVRSTHRAYQCIHLAIGVVLLAAGILMLLYGLGRFPDITPAHDRTPVESRPNQRVQPDAAINGDGGEEGQE